MHITEIKVRKIFYTGNLKAIMSITIDGCLAVHEVKVVQGNERLFVAMPSCMNGYGNYRDIIYPIGSEVRKQFEDVILRAYNNYFKLW